MRSLLLLLIATGLAFPSVGQAGMKKHSEAAHLEKLWTLGLYQTFFQHWLTSVEDKAFAQSEPLKLLEEKIQGELGSSLESEAILFSDSQRVALTRLPDRPVYDMLRAWASLRSGLNAKRALARMSAHPSWRPMLVDTIVLAQVRQGKVQEAIGLLKQEVSSASVGEALNEYYLQLGRLNYQTTALDEAQVWYEKVPRGSPRYLTAQEELLWVWLRTGDQAKLRGTLKSLSLPVYRDRISPDGYVVRAISDLKLCYLGEAEKELRAFLADNASWVAEVDRNLKSPVPPRPPKPDWFSARVERALEKREAEAGKISELAKASTGAKQKKWVLARQQLEEGNSRLSQQRDQEYRRQWRGYGRVIQEAIRKLRFVKVELIRNLGQGLGPSGEVKEVEVSEKHQKALVKAELKDQLAFPADEVVWPDEIFRLRAVAANQCLSMRRAR